MIYTLPLLHALRRLFPAAHLTVACDPLGAPIAQACSAVNEVVLLETSWNPWLAAYKNAARLQDFDWVLAAKGGFDRRLALLTRLTNAAIRIGFEHRSRRQSGYYTDPVELPDNPHEEHQIDTLLRLLRHVGMLNPTEFTAINLSLTLPDSSQEAAAKILAEPPFARSQPFVLINLSSTVRLKFREEDFITLSKRLLSLTDFAIGLVGTPADQQKAAEIALCMNSKRIVALETPGPLDLAALLDRAALLITPEGGAAHLAAAVNTPALILWSEGPFKKWHSRNEKHFFVHAKPGEKNIPVDRVWETLQPLLTDKKASIDKVWSSNLKTPSNPDLDF
jgi:ADP-heptose:LPS heptosyltransferase